MKNKKTLILGASSFLGKYFLKSNYLNKFFGTYNNHEVNSSIKFNSLSDDISELDLDWNDFSHAVILIGDTDPDSCYENPESSNLTNVVSIKKIIDFLVIKNIFIIFTSSEFIFDGQKGPYKELDKAIPILLYGHQKLEIETYLKSIQRSCILRLAKMYGDFDNDRTLFTNWVKDIDANKKIICANDQYFSPVYVEDVVKIINLVIRNNISGVFHVSCGKKYRRDFLLDALCEAKRIRPEIKFCSINDFDLAENRPLDVSMDSSKITKLLNFKFTNTEDFIKNRFSV